jgi:hypothetical protein
MSSDDQFTALGPAGQGFFTDGANINEGVNVQGKFVGVYGECLKVSNNRQGKEGTGVYGTGYQYGVYGISGNIRVEDAPGFGEEQDAIGVVGASLKSPGVVGVSDGIIASSTVLLNPDPTTEPTGVVGISRTKTGVFGLSLGGSGAGVVGRSVSARMLDLESKEEAAAEQEYMV